MFPPSLSTYLNPRQVSLCVENRETLGSYGNNAEELRGVGTAFLATLHLSRVESFASVNCTFPRALRAQALSQRSPTFLAPDLVLWKTVFPQIGGWWGRGMVLG